VLSRNHMYTYFTKERLRAEIVIMKKNFSNAIFCEQDGEWFWDYTFMTKQGNAHRVQIYYPHNYPYAQPKVYPFPRLMPEQFFDFLKRHIHYDGSLCIQMSWDPDRNNVASMIPWVVKWFLKHHEDFNL